MKSLKTGKLAAEGLTAMPLQPKVAGQQSGMALDGLAVALRDPHCKYPFTPLHMQPRLPLGSYRETQHFAEKPAPQTLSISHHSLNCWKFGFIPPLNPRAVGWG